MEIDIVLYRQIAEVAFPYANRRIEEARTKNVRFSHYTSAFAALQIIEKKEVWLRNALLMNDFSEVQHGQDRLRSAWHDDSLGGRLKQLLENVRVGLSGELAQAFDQRAHDRISQTYLISISEHGNGSLDEDHYGRLSMWRAYGGATNVAFVFKNTPFLTESDALSAFTNPVLYCDQNRFNAEFSIVVDALEEHLETAKQLGADNLKSILENAFHFSTVAAKHPGFAEEQEWRVIYSPSVWPSDKIRSDIEVISGVPQRVYKLPMQNFPEQGFFGATLPELLEEIIIGPTESGWPIYDALVEKLHAAGVENPESKVRRSDIPLRR